MSRTTKVGALAFGAAGLLATAGCGAGADAALPTTDAEGLASYACALVDLAGATPAEQWSGVIGQETADEVRAAAGVSGLLGAVNQSPLEGYEDLMEPATDLYQGLMRIDTELVQESLDALAPACDEHGLPEGDPDVSMDGQVAYSCLLVADVVEDGRPAEEWLSVGEPAGSEEGLLMAEMSGFTGLMGGMNGYEMPGHEELSRASADVLAGLTRLDTVAADEGLATADTYCQEI